MSLTNSERCKLYYQRHTEQVKNRVSKYRRDNPDKIMQARERLRDYKRKYNKEYRISHMQYHRDYERAYWKKNPLKLKARSSNRRVLMANAGKLTLQDIQQVYEQNIKKYGTLTCYLCSKPIVFGDDQLEHKMPITRGGSNRLDNLDIAHKSCNSSKKDQTEEEYRAKEETW